MCYKTSLRRRYCKLCGGPLPIGPLRGEQQSQHKLTKAKVRYIRKHTKPGAQVKLARKFGVSEATISLVVNKKKWRHV